MGDKFSELLAVLSLFPLGMEFWVKLIKEPPLFWNR